MMKLARVEQDMDSERDKVTIDISLVDVTVGEYVIVHAGFAIEILDEAEALETLKVCTELLEREAELDSQVR